MRVVISPDSFKGSIMADEAARAIAEGWRQARPGDEIVLRPMADGGEGTLDAIEGAVPGARRMPVRVTGPDDRPVDTSWLLLPDGTGVVELALTSGITLMAELDAEGAHTKGLGEAIADALEHRATRLLVAIGGSASTDGGAGMLSALGARFEDVAGQPVPDGNRGLAALARVHLDGLRALPPDGVVVLSDVNSPLLGPLGSAAVFGPQKGGDADGVARMEAALARLAALVPADPCLPGSGAAGGTGFALLLWGATIARGAERVAEAIGVDTALAGAGAVITGEGRYDSQSGAGKVAGLVAAMAAARAVPALLIAGRIDAEPEGFHAVLSLSQMAGDAREAQARARHFLVRAGSDLARGFRPC